MAKWSWPNARLIHRAGLVKIFERATRLPRSRKRMPPLLFKKKAVKQEQTKVAGDSWVYRASAKEVRALASGVNTAAPKTATPTPRAGKRSRCRRFWSGRVVRQIFQRPPSAASTDHDLERRRRLRGWLVGDENFRSRA